MARGFSYDCRDINRTHSKSFKYRYLLLEWENYVITRNRAQKNCDYYLQLLIEFDKLLKLCSWYRLSHNGKYISLILPLYALNKACQ